MASGDEAAAALQAELYRVAALHAVQHVQAQLQGSVESFLLRHRPLAKYTAAPGGGHNERVGRYLAQGEQ